MMVSVFVGTSVDGFIARPNGGLDFLPPGGGEPHGYNEFVATVDAIVIGRKTFETVLGMKPWPYAQKRVVVLSSRVVDFSAARGPVEQMAGSPAEILSQLAASGVHHVYVDGGNTIQRFLRAGLVTGSSSLACQSSLATASLFSAPCLTTFHSITLPPGIILAA